MTTPVSGSGSGPQEPIESRPRTDQPAAQQEGAASEAPTQPALGGLRSRPDTPAQSRGTPVSSPEGTPLAAHAHPDLARNVQRDGPRLLREEELRWKTSQPAGSFIAGEPLVLRPTGYNAVVGAATEEGMIFSVDGEELTVYEAMTMSLGIGDGSTPFYLVVEGAAEGGVASLAQRWATISGSEVIAREPIFTLDDKRQVVIKGQGPLHRFSPIPFETPPARLAIENGELVEILETGHRATEPLAHLREKLGSGGEGTVFRMGEDLAAKIFVPDVNAPELIERGRRVLDRRASEGFRVQKKLSDPQHLPSGLVMQYLELGSASHQDILVPVDSKDKATGKLRMTGLFTINHARAEVLDEHTIVELDKMRELLETHRPFHHDPEFNDPEIMFDRNGLPYFSDPVQDILPGYDDFPPPAPDDLHEEMLQVIAQLREVAQTNVSARRLSATSPETEPDK